MRIRKYASMILGTANEVVFPSLSLSYPIWSPPQPHCDMLQPCTVNYSTLDLYRSPPPSPQPPGVQHKRPIHHHQHHQVVVAATAAGGAASLGDLIQERKRNAEIVDGDQEEDDAGLVKGNEKEKKKKKTKQKKKKVVAKIEESCCKQGIMLCKKTDGKTWRCKNPALHSHRFCQHHLDLSRSYQHHIHLGGEPASPPAANTKLLRRTQPQTKSTVMMGRCCERNATHHEIPENEIELQPPNSKEDAACCSDNEEEEQDRNQICDGEQEGTLAQMMISSSYNPPKRKRKRIKARSLKSLL